jgi:hypothetical protein
MNEQQILNAIADACQDESLRFQVIIQDSTLHIYINRPTVAQLNYQQLKQKIYTAVITLYSTKFSNIWLYCRVLGIIEPDWQSVLEIDASNSIVDAKLTTVLDEITDALDAANSIVEKIEQELETSEFFLDDWNDFGELPTTAGDSDEN